MKIIRIIIIITAIVTLVFLASCKNQDYKYQDYKHHISIVHLDGSTSNITRIFTYKTKLILQNSCIVSRVITHYEALICGVQSFNYYVTAIE